MTWRSEAAACDGAPAPGAAPVTPAAPAAAGALPEAAGAGASCPEVGGDIPPGADLAQIIATI
ncbi:hypothetical protein ACWEOR_28555, partial [Micromonospora chalcea]